MDSLSHHSGRISWHEKGESIAIREDRPDGLATIVPVSQISAVS